MITVTSPSVPAGQYNIKCQFDNLGVWVQVQNNTFTAYNRSAILLSSIAPNETRVGSFVSFFNASITGSGFVDTGFLKCVLSPMSVSEGEGRRMVPAFIISSTEVLCSLSSREKSSLLEISLLFGQDDLPAISTVKFLYYAAQPEALSIQFRRNPRQLLLTLDKPAKIKKEQCTCADIFDGSAVGKFGTGCRCFLETVTKLIIILGNGATILPNQNLNFTNGSFLTLSQEQTKIIPGFTTLELQPPSNPPKPRVTLFGQNTIGKN